MEIIEMKLFNQKRGNYVILKDNNFFLPLTKIEYNYIVKRKKGLLKNNRKLRDLVQKK